MPLLALPKWRIKRTDIQTEGWIEINLGQISELENYYVVSDFLFPTSFFLLATALKIC